MISRFLFAFAEKVNNSTEALDNLAIAIAPPDSDVEKDAINQKYWNSLKRRQAAREIAQARQRVNENGPRP